MNTTNWDSLGATSKLHMKNASNLETQHYTLANLKAEPETKASRRNVRRNAVLVGIDEYLNPGNNLQGCVNDAKDMGQTLMILGFPPRNIRYLTNEQATKQNIVRELERLTKYKQAGDVCIYYQSSHGSQTTDLDNDEETDQVDEMVIPHDFDWDDESTYLIDDDFHKYFTDNLPAGVISDVIFDTCYSGTGTKSFGPATIQMMGKGKQRRLLHQRYLPPPLSQRQKINSMRPQTTKINYIGNAVIQRKSDVNRVQNNTLWSACQDYQVSWELDMGDGEVRGAFTYYFTRVLRRSNGLMTRGEIYNTVRQSMADDSFEQIPDLATPDNNPEAVDLFPFKKFSEVDRQSEVKK